MVGSYNHGGVAKKTPKNLNPPFENPAYGPDHSIRLERSQNPGFWPTTYFLAIKHQDFHRQKAGFISREMQAVEVQFPRLSYSLVVLTQQQTVGGKRKKKYNLHRTLLGKNLIGQGDFRMETRKVKSKSLPCGSS